MSIENTENQKNTFQGFVSKHFKWIFILGFWVLIILLSISSQLVHVPSCGSLLEAISLVDLPNYGTWALISPLILLIGSKFPFEVKKWKSRVLVLFVLGILIGLLQSIPQQIISVLTDTSTTHEKSISHSLLFHIIPQMPLKFLIYSAILGMGYAFDYYKWFQERTASVGQLEKQLVQAKLDALKSQLHPHFLFNTLNTISALVEKDPTASRRMIARLSELLRLTLSTNDKQEITLEQELLLLKHYLGIEQIRFQDRLKIEYEISHEAHTALVPYMILQPLVENAIRHGINQKRTGGIIKISAKRDNGFLSMTVQDNGPGLNGKEKSKKSGVGLKNTRSRLTQLYKQDHKFELKNLEDGGLKVNLSFPFHKTPLLQ